MTTEKPTTGQTAEAWMRYISDAHKYGSLTAQTMISLTGQEAAVTAIFADGFRFGYIQRQLDEPKVPAHDLMLHAHQHDTPQDEPHEHPHTGPGHMGIEHSHPHRHAPAASSGNGEQQR